ncbi:MAG: hypothetical protein WC456_04525 [Patescibacteria group bacterium]
MKKVIRNTVLVVTGLFLLILLLTGGNFLFFWGIFNWIQGGVHRTTGLDIGLSKVITALIIAVLVMLPFGRIALSFTPLPLKNKRAYRALVFSGIAIFFLLSYLTALNTFFDPETGQPVKYYSEWQDGTIHFYSEPGFDPIIGDSLKQVTSEIIIKSRGLNIKKNSPFNPETGKPSQYYSEWPDKTIHFYSKPGFDPTTGDSLKAVTREIVLKSQGLLPEPDYYFDPGTGEALKYYSLWPDGQYKFYSGPGYDPETGDALKRVTKEVILRSRGLWPEETPAPEPPKPHYFGRKDDKKKQGGLSETPEPDPIGKVSVAPPKNEEIPDINELIPTSEVNFRNETHFTFQILNSSKHVMFTVPPRRIIRKTLAAGEYYAMGGGKDRKLFVSAEKKQTDINFLNKPQSQNQRSQRRVIRRY